ncbi:FAD-dependent oxidoreductase [Buchananella hordeovulneris]|uniref:FAD-dependent oxidoreductase n=1 Tax=Buchananella hordeovulneris TaxID=52770 RepID=UPI000F5F5112|nr:FAD-dependent oxidoreductase [Buchananella hordeovulneris]RRD45030.1 FAD-dependent oxidoreductase [Buchananella hordeovulneris]
MYDAIVIGSGIGGLTTAGLLAQVANQRVLVLEKHLTPGGLTHTFSRNGATWDTGVHYLGQLAPGKPLRRYFDLLSGGQLAWNPIPAPYDRFIYPDLDFAAPTGRDNQIAELTALFPTEANAIRRWFRDTRRAAHWLTLSYIQTMTPGPIGAAIRWFQRCTGALATTTTRSVLDARFRSPELKALLASQWGDYGLPPHQSAFASHALIVEHYLDGAWFPTGGSAMIARTIEKGIEEKGGAVRVAQDVTEILIEQGRAVGVRVCDRRSAQSRQREYRAPVIISGIGALSTLTGLLPTAAPVGTATAPLRQQLAALGRSSSAVSVHLQLKEHPRTIGASGGNIWVYRDTDHDAPQDAALLHGQPRSVFVSFSAAKSGESHHTAEIVSFTGPEPFARWADRPPHNRGADYEEFKHRLAAGLIALAETALPGLRELIDYVDVSTPLTFEHYTAQPGGACYGLPGTPQRVAAGPIGPRTPVPGLFLTGQDVVASGIAGALMGGVAAASQVLGPHGYPLIASRLRKPPRPFTSQLPEGKYHGRVASTRRLTATVWELVLDVPGVQSFTPGQFARLEVAPAIWRDYSIVGIHGHQVRLLISTHTGGPGSRFVATAMPGSALVVELPLGQFSGTGAKRRRVFVATGTGLAPLLPMLARAPRTDDLLLFGCRFAKDDLTQLLDDPLPANIIRCITGEQVPGARRARVTEVLAELACDVADTEFFLCGSAAMVADATTLLAQRGAQYIYTEPY